MKYLILLWLVVAAAAHAAITQAEYGFDTDPGPGFAQPLPVDRINDELSVVDLRVPLGTLPAGLHRVFTRVRDDSGQWSQPHFQWFYRFSAVVPRTNRVGLARFWFSGQPVRTIDVPDAPQASFAAQVYTGDLPEGLHLLHTIFQENYGTWSQRESRFVYRFSNAAPQELAVVQGQAWWDNSAPTTFDLPDSSRTRLVAELPVLDLPVGLHTLSVRFQDQLGRWCAAGTQLVYRFPEPGPQSQTIVQARWGFDNQPLTPIELADAPQVSFAEIIPVADLAVGLHTFKLELMDQHGVWSAPRTQLIYKFPPVNPQEQTVVAASVQVDNGTPQPLDVPDGSTAELVTVLSGLQLAPGLHTVTARFRSDGSVWSPVDRRQVFVIPGRPYNGPAAQLAAAEYFINADPGVGQGVPIYPIDGAWDEPDETVAQGVHNIPPGKHWLGLRFRDDQGHWSSALVDSFWVGPLVVIRTSGNNVILDWTAPQGVEDFYVHRASTYGGAYARVDSTQDSTWTDVGALNRSSMRGYYYVTHRRASISNFRLPNLDTPYKD